MFKTLTKARPEPRVKLEGNAVVLEMGSIETVCPKNEGKNVSERQCEENSLARYVSLLRCQR